MSRQYTADGRRISSMSHAKHRHDCSLPGCDAYWFGNGGAAQHGRAHVRRGEAVEMVKHRYDGTTSRVFVAIGDAERQGKFRDAGFTVEAP